MDGFYVCSPNTTVGASYGSGGIGGLIGHAKGNITIDNVTIKNSSIAERNGDTIHYGLLAGYVRGDSINIRNC